MNECINCGKIKEEHLICTDGIFCGRYFEEMTGQEYAISQQSAQKGCGKELINAGLNCGEVYADGRITLCKECNISEDGE